MQLKRSLISARELRDAIRADPHSSETHKAAAQEYVEKFERLNFELLSSDTELMHATIISAGSKNPSDPPVGRRG